MSQNLEIVINEDFKKAKRNVLWFSSALLLISFASDTITTIPSFPYSIPIIVVKVALIASTIYAGIGFWNETRVLSRQNSNIARTMAASENSADGFRNAVNNYITEAKKLTQAITSINSIDIPSVIKDHLSKIESSQIQESNEINTIQTNIKQLESHLKSVKIEDDLYPDNIIENIKEQSEQLKARFVWSIDTLSNAEMTINQINQPLYQIIEISGNIQKISDRYSSKLSELIKIYDQINIGDVRMMKWYEKGLSYFMIISSIIFSSISVFTGPLL